MSLIEIVVACGVVQPPRSSSAALKSASSPAESGELSTVRWRERPIVSDG